MKHAFVSAAATLAILCLAMDASHAQSPAASTIAPTGKVETVREGFAFTEGPAWDPRGSLFFTDIHDAAIHRLSSGDKLTVFTDDSGHANGIMVAADGRMLVCQMDESLLTTSIRAR